MVVRLGHVVVFLSLVSLPITRVALIICIPLMHRHVMVDRRVSLKVP